MAKVICTLPNASDVINGVKFTSDRGQKISEDISDTAAAAFTAIPGYKLVGDKAADKAAADAAAKATADAAAKAANK